MTAQELSPEQEATVERFGIFAPSLTDYAKQEAQKAEVGAGDFANPVTLAVASAEWGILRLAEALQRKDVIEAGAAAAVADLSAGSFADAFKVGVAAMLAKVVSRGE